MTAAEFARQLSAYLDVPIEPKANVSLFEAGTGTGNALLDFVRGYDTSQVEIGMITFPPWALKTTRGWHVGNDEADPILLDSATGEVWLKEHGEDHMLCPCAKDSDRFMDALLTVERVVSKSDAEGESDEEFDRRKAAATCAAAAGGDRYRTYYYTFFGTE